MKDSILWTILVYEWITRMPSSMLVSENFISFYSPFAAWYIQIRPSASQLSHLYCRLLRAIFKWHQLIKDYLRLHQWWVSAKFQIPFRRHCKFSPIKFTTFLSCIRHAVWFVFLGLFGRYKRPQGGADCNSFTWWRLRIVIIGGTILLDIYVLSIF